MDAAAVQVPLAVTAILWGWALAQYPALLEPHVTITAAAAEGAVLAPVLIAVAVGAALLAPSLWMLYSLFQRRVDTGGTPTFEPGTDG